jgi:hypothetical protein
MWLLGIEFLRTSTRSGPKIFLCVGVLSECKSVTHVYIA